MPLSEDEQRVLRDIERSFYENDPAFARTVSSTSLYRHAARKCKLSAAGFIVGIAILLSTFTRFPVVAFFGFMVMVGCGFVFVQNVRRIGKAGLHDAAESDTAKQMNQSLDTARRRVRDIFKRPE